MAGIPNENPALYHRIRFGVGDPAAWMSIRTPESTKSLFLVRDIEMQRAKESVRVDQVACPADYTPAAGMSGDRATATAQAVAECLRQHEVQTVTTDRTLPFIFAWHIQQAGIALDYSAELGVLERRTKDEQEIEWIRQAQEATEATMLMALETIARAQADSAGILHVDAEPLTSERVQALISADLLQRGFSNPHGSIVATLPHTADCHGRGSGPLVTGESVIVDIFPQNNEHHYCGDCTRTVVHGDVPDMLKKMHAAVVDAKARATSAAVVGASADEVHSATKSGIEAHGFAFARGQISDDPVMPHGTGHGIGLEVHEPILLDDNGGTLLAGEALTIEPGLYSRKYGGVRVEDIIVTTVDGPALNLNRLPEGLSWA